MPSTVSVIVPCYNEQETIGSLLAAVLAQTYPRRQLEVVIADGLSQDNTRTVITEFGRAHPDLTLRLVDNPQRTIPSGLNTAIGSSRGDIIVRLDAHSIPIPEYVERCVQAIERGRGSNVGGVWMIRPGNGGWMARGIAAAAGHRLGAGDALYRVGAREGPVDTVPFGAFRKSLVDKLGGFDETLLTNEDYEFNARVRRDGGVIWLDPGIRSTYIARSSLSQLARQYWRYGYWKFQMLRRHPSTLRWRQALPPALVLSVVLLTIAAILWPKILILPVIEVGAYLLALLAAGLDMAWRAHDAGLILSGMLAIATMHFAWGSGFLWSLGTGWSNKNG